MPSYGGYEIRRPHALGSAASVYEAVSTDGIAGRYALKIFHPPPSTKAKRIFAIEGWLLAAERQQAAAKSGPVPLEVRAFGRCDEGAYMVMPWREDAFEALYQSLSPKGDTLRVLAAKLFDALEAWESAYGTPHGKLKPANVFSEGTGLLSSRSLRLSDPWYLPNANPAERRRSDLAQIGEMLVRVVRRRAGGAWPIEDAPEWHVLGRTGTAWREFCNFLLDPNPPGGELTIANARQRLGKIPYDLRPARTAGLAAVAAVLAVMAGVLGFARFGTREALPNNLLPLAEWVGNPNALRTEITPEWGQLARAYNTWIGDVQRNTDRWNSTPALMSTEDPLRKALVDFRTAAAELDPRVLVPEAATNSLGVLAESPPENVRAQLLRELVSRRVQQAWTRVNEFAVHFGDWPGWTQMTQTADQIEARGRPRAAQALRQRAPAAPPPEERAEVTTVNRLRAFNELSQDRDGALALLPRWRDLEATAAEMAASGDRVQLALPRLVLAPVEDGSSLGDFAAAIEGPVAELHRRRQQFLAPEVARERFVRESPLMSEQAEITAGDLARWEQQLSLYSRIPAADDPRTAEDWDDRLRRIAANEPELETETPAGDGAVQPLSRSDLERELATMRTTVGGLRSREVLRVDRETVVTDVTRIRGLLNALDQRVEATLALLRPELWLDNVAKKTWRFPASQARWAAWRQRDVGTVAATALTQDRARFSQLRQMERRVRAWLDDFEGQPGLGGLAVPNLGEIDADTTTALQTLERRRREELANAVLTALPWPDAHPATTWSAAAAQPEPVRLITAYRGWLGQLPEFATDVNRLGALLTGGFGWSEGISDVLQRLTGRNGSDALEGRAGAWMSDGRRLERLAQSTDRAELLAAARENSLSLQLTTWRRLGALQGWPTTTEDLDVELAVGTDLKAKVAAGVKEPARRDALVTEVTRETQARWLRAARTATQSETDFSAVAQRMERFGVAEPALDAPMRFNVNLWRMKSADWDEGDLTKLRERRDNFVAGIRAFSGGLNDQQSVSRLLEALAKLGLKDDPAASAARTPRAAGWREEYLDGGQRVRVEWPGGRQRVALEFKLVLPTDGTLPFYLATRTISVGEFIDQVNERREGEAVMAAMPGWVRGEAGSVEPFSAIMAWQPRPGGRGLDMSSTWIYHPAPEMTPAVLDEVGVEVPSNTTPMQRVPPDAAKVFAERLLGARLPKPEEWQALIRLVQAAPSGNFRDDRFAKLWGFLNNYQVAEQRVAWRPNQGVYLPLQAAESNRVRRDPIADDGSVRPGGASLGLWPAPVDKGPDIAGFTHLIGNVWIYLYNEADQQYYVAGGSVLSPPSLDPLTPHKVEGVALIGSARSRRITEGFADVGIRPAFDAPLGLRERFEMLRLVRAEQFLKL